jgi:molecular chaperone IbpA
LGDEVGGPCSYRVDVESEAVNEASVPRAVGGYLHRGIARRTFERRFSLADHMKVVGASLDNGLLYVDVVREVPEAAKPRAVKIGTTVTTVQPQATEQKAA